MPEPIPAHIRAELDQTPAWWDREFDRLVKKQIPRGIEYHQDHDLDRVENWSGRVLVEWCLECGVTVDRPPDG